MLPVAALGSYGDTVAYGVGVLVVVGVVGYVVMTRHVGREGDEWAHEKAVSSGVDDLSKSKLAVGREPDSAWMNDMEWLVRDDRNANRRRRIRQWLTRRHPRRLVGHGRRIEDADGRAIYVASVNGRRLAHRDKDELMADVETVAEAVSEYDTPPATLSERYYEYIVDGFVDLGDASNRIRGDCQTRIESNMRRNGELDSDDLFERLVYSSRFRYPPEIVREKLAQLEGRDIRHRQDGSVTYQRFR